MMKLPVALAVAALAFGLAGPAGAADRSTPPSTSVNTASTECDDYCDAFLKVLHEAHEVVQEQEREAAEYFEEDDVGFGRRAVIWHIVEPAPHARRPSATGRAAKAAAARNGGE